jgi:hypothetical protein
MAKVAVNPASVTTTDATPTVFIVYPIPPDTSANLLLFLNAKSTAGDVFAGVLSRIVKRVGSGAATPVGVAVVVSSQKDAGATTWNAGIGAQGNNLIITVTGAVGVTIRWNVSGDVQTN